LALKAGKLTGAIVLDRQKKVISANHKAKELFSPRLNSSSRVTLSDLLQTDESDTLVTNLENKSTSEIVKVNNHFLEVSISRLLIENDQPHYLLMINDVSDKIKVENQLRAKIEELEFLNQELDEFVNVVSHDFKTPLTSISLLAELALREDSPEKQRDLVKQIRQSSIKLKELLKGLNLLVDTRKNRSDKVELIDFQERLDLMLSEYEEKLKEINGEVIADFRDAPNIAYFKAHIDSFFSNMITNAIKYRKLDYPLCVEVKSRKEREYTILSVKDNGIGMDLSKHINKLFQPFKRLTDQGTGSGLGLSIVKRMIEKDQGYLEVFSEPDVGTEFKAYLKEQA